MENDKSNKISVCGLNHIRIYRYVLGTTGADMYSFVSIN